MDMQMLDQQEILKMDILEVLVVKLLVHQALKSFFLVVQEEKVVLTKMGIVLEREAMVEV